MALSRASAILWDLDDTLVPTSAIDRHAIAHAAALAAERVGGGAGADEYAQRFRAQLAAEPFPPAGSAMTAAEWRTGLWARALGEDGAPAPADLAQTVHDAWADTRLSLFRVPPDVAAMLGRLRGAGYVMGVVTNGHAEIQRAKLRACDAAALFDETRLVVSGEQPEAKPQPSIFHTALRALGARAEEAVMVGDNLRADVQGGLNAGLLATVWVRGDSPEPPADAPVPTHRVSSVLEVEGLLMPRAGAAGHPPGGGGAA